MTLGFLQISTARSKSDFLQHIHELIHIRLANTDTYYILFAKLILHDGGNIEWVKAAQDWVDFNTKGQEDSDVFNSIIIDTKTKTNQTDEISVDSIYAIFDLIP